MPGRRVAVTVVLDNIWMFPCFKFMSRHPLLWFPVVATAAITMEERKEKQLLNSNLFPPQRQNSVRV